MRHRALQQLQFVRHGRPTIRRGFSLIEAVTAVAIVTISCSAMLYSVSQAMQASESGQAMNRANSLAQDLMNEISACHWSDPNNPTHWGLEDGEYSQNRAAFDDIDDFDHWSGPPQTRAGLTYDALQHQFFPDVHSSDYSKYVCSVRVESVTSSGQVLQDTSTSPFRRVTVQVSHPEIQTVTLSRTFVNLVPLLGRTYWYDPQLVEPKATVTIIAAPANTSTPTTVITEPVETVKGILGLH